MENQHFMRNYLVEFYKRGKILMCTCKVSVIVAIYNVEKYLERCLESLINQRLRELEIILIDDGSTDDSPEICDKYAEKDNRIIVVHKKNQGLGMARNSGLELAKGEYVVFVDSDDFIEKNAYWEMYEAISSENAEMLITNYYEYDTKNDTIKELRTIHNSKIAMDEQVKKIACQMVGANPLDREADDIGMSVWKNMYSRKFIEENHIRFCSEREYVSEDAIFQLMIIPKMKKILLSTNCYYYYCNNERQSLSSTFRESKFEEYKKLYKKEYELLQKEEIINNGKYYIATTFLGNIRSYIKQLAVSQYTMKKKKDLVRKIHEDIVVQEVLNWYPYEKTSFKQRLFSVALKKRNTNLVLLFGKLQGMR